MISCFSPPHQLIFLLILMDFGVLFCLFVFFFTISWIGFQLAVLIFGSLLLRPTPATFPCLLLFHLLLHSGLSPPLPPGRSGLAASYLSVKALVPQMPKLLKSLFPAREERKELRPSPSSQQVWRRWQENPHIPVRSFSFS